MRIGIRAVCVCLLSTMGLRGADATDAHWPQWRGPFDNGVARTAAPTEWSASKNLAWQVEIAGLGHSSPSVWGDRLFITTAVPTQPFAAGTAGVDMRRMGGGTGVGVEHRFVVMCLDRKTGKVLWE